MGIVIACVVVVLIVVFIVLDYRSYDRREADRFIRGRKLLSYTEAKQKGEDILLGSKERRKTRRFLWWSGTKPAEPTPDWYFGCVPMPLKAAKEHTLVAGTTGSGKTILLRSFARDLLPRVANNPNARALIYDAKRDTCSFLATLGIQHRAVILNPFDLRSAQWDMAADIDSPGAAAELALRLVPDEQDSNPYFSRASRHILKEVATALHLRAPGSWDFRDLILACRDIETLKSVLDHPRTKHIVTQYFNDRANVQAILATMATKLLPHEVVAACWHRSARRFSLRKWVSSNYILVLPNDEAHHASIDPLNQLIMKRLSELVLEHGVSDDRVSFFFLDEYREMGKVEGVRSLLNLGRAFGVCMFIGYQSQRGLETVFSEAEADEIAGLCAQRAFLRLQDSSAAWAAKCLGEQERYEVQWSSSSGSSGGSTSTTHIRVKRPIVEESEIRDLPLPTVEKGLLAVYDCSRIGVWSVWKPSKYWPAIPSASARSSFPDFIPRPSQHQVLDPWTEEDYRRLQISVPPSPGPALKLRVKPKAGGGGPAPLPHTRP